MGERRSLVEGIDTTDVLDGPEVDKFVYQNKPRATKPAASSDRAAQPPQPQTEPPAPASDKPKPVPLTGIGRVPVGARIRTELETALKRASLERQLDGLEPYSVQDIVEEALTPWLRSHGYLP